MFPKITKYKKMHRGRLKGKASRNNELKFGDYGIQCLESKWITSNQIESTRRVISRYIKKTGFLWIKIFPDKSVTARSEESRMGSGKGSVKYWVAVVKRENILFEIKGIPKEMALECLKVASSKLPLKTKIIAKQI
jgi:large subunit ribosomal protein L16